MKVKILAYKQRLSKTDSKGTLSITNYDLRQCSLDVEDDHRLLITVDGKEVPILDIQIADIKKLYGIHK